MRNNIRVSGVDVVGNILWGTHFCQLYQTNKELMNVVSPCFKAGLENNELCIWVISQLHEVKEAKDALRKSAPDFDINLEVRDTTESKRAENEIRRRV